MWIRQQTWSRWSDYEHLRLKFGVRPSLVVANDAQPGPHHCAVEAKEDVKWREQIPFGATKKTATVRHHVALELGGASATKRPRKNKRGNFPTALSRCSLSFERG